MNDSDNNFIQQKDSLIKNLEDIADFLGDEDAKKVSLATSSSGVKLNTVSANSDSVGTKADASELVESS